MNNLKIGDKVKVKKLSLEKFIEIYHKKHKINWYSYHNYLDMIEIYFNKIFKITDIYINRVYLKSRKYNDVWFYEEEIEKVSYLKTKFKIVKQLLETLTI